MMIHAWSGKTRVKELVFTSMNRTMKQSKIIFHFGERKINFLSYITQYFPKLSRANEWFNTADSCKLNLIANFQASIWNYVFISNDDSTIF